MFSSRLQSSYTTTKLFHLEYFVIYSIRYFVYLMLTIVQCILVSTFCACYGEIQDDILLVCGL